MQKVKVKRKLPDWFKVKFPTGENFHDLKEKFSNASLNTVCEEAACPNIADCWDRKTATFMILGDTCTRACSYCNVKTGWPGFVDKSEPFRVAMTIKQMELNYVVITSVDRDDLEDAGSEIFAKTISETKKLSPNIKVEVLTPDFNGNKSLLKNVIIAKPDVMNHNIETVRRVFKKVRPKGDYDLSMNFLLNSKDINPKLPTKSGMMVGLGETKDEIIETMQDLLDNKVDLLTIGQYLRPSKKHHPIIKFYNPKEFTELQKIGMDMGFSHVASGPLVRSSYHADEQHNAAVEKLINQSKS
mgnify:FL=1